MANGAGFNDDSSKPEDLGRPGHMFPLMVKEGESFKERDILKLQWIYQYYLV